MRLRLSFALLVALANCHHDPQPMAPQPGELPPLPPASGTPVGYLVDASGQLALRDDQLDRLRAIDASLAAQDAEIDTQLRQLERPMDEEQLTPQQQKAGVKRQRYNNAPGASTIPNADADKLHKIRDANDRKALAEAWALLDPTQQQTARQILEDRGVQVPAAAAKPAPTATPAAAAAQPAAPAANAVPATPEAPPPSGS